MARKIDIEANLVLDDGTVSIPYSSRTTIDNNKASITEFIRAGCTELGISVEAALTMLQRFRSFTITNSDETKRIRFTITDPKE